MTSDQHGPLTPWATRATMAGIKGCQVARHGANPKNRPQFRWESATRLHEAGITSNRESTKSR